MEKERKKIILNILKDKVAQGFGASGLLEEFMRGTLKTWEYDFEDIYSLQDDLFEIIVNKIPNEQRFKGKIKIINCPWEGYSIIATIKISINKKIKELIIGEYRDIIKKPKELIKLIDKIEKDIYKLDLKGEYKFINF